MAKEFINNLLKVAGSEKTFDDLFEVDYGFDEDYLYDEIEEYLEMNDVEFDTEEGYSEEFKEEQIKNAKIGS